MCGICGAVDLGAGPVRAEELGPMNQAMRLRGPDDAGTWVSDKAALGHRRLSIIDLSGGHQPMGNEDGQVQAVLNGEIYNFVALRQRLEALGHTFRTRSDTEVVVHGYEQWGEDLPNHLDGMFALAVWDARQRRLLLARDRFGKKPLCWSSERGRFLFASTQTALLQHPLAPRGIDETSLARYLALEFVPAPAALLRGVHKLPAGTLLVLDEAGAIRERRFFHLSVQARRPAPSEDEAAEELRQRLLDGVKKRLVADVPLGIFLSGGIDSSAVTWAAAQVSGARLKTFSLGFSASSFDESDHARAVAQHFGTDHVEERLEPEGLLAVVPLLGQILDEPMADASIVPTYCLSRLARRHVTVALGGDGGDELLAGYPTYQAHLLAGALRPLLRRSLVALARRVAARLPVSHENLSLDFKLKTTLAGLLYPEPVRNYAWMGAFRPEELPALLHGEPPDADEVFAPVAEIYQQALGATHVERVLEQDVVLYLCHLILMKVDRASMANSLEVRAPLLDTRFAEYAAGLPLRMKCRPGQSKRIFKRAMTGLLPERILRRPKKGFGMPIGAWLRGPLQGLAQDLLLDRAHGLRATGLFREETLSRLLDEHIRGVVDHRKRLWTLMILSLWWRHHLS